MMLEQAFDRIERHLGKLWRAYEPGQTMPQVSFNEYDYLKAIQSLENPRLSDVASAMCVSRPSASTMIAKLERRGLATRSRSRDDGRVINIVLTEKGRGILQMDEQLYAQFANSIRDRLSKEEVSQLEHLLSEICKDLK